MYTVNRELVLYVFPSVFTLPLVFLGWVWVVVCGRNLPARSHPPPCCRHHPKILQQQGQRPHGVCGQSPQKPLNGDLRYMNDQQPSGTVRWSPNTPTCSEVRYVGSHFTLKSWSENWRLMRNALKDKKRPKTASQRTWEGWSDWMRTL